MQKEPKLVRARKIPEWEKYDSEIFQFSRKLATQGLIHSRFAAADTNVLANQGTDRMKPSDKKEVADDSEDVPRDEL